MMLQSASPDTHEARMQLLALALFDGATRAYGLQDSARRLLPLAVAYHAAAIGADQRSDRVARDMALAAPIAELSHDDQAIVASAVAFQREKLRPQREPAYRRLGAKKQQTALALAAILQIAEAAAAAPDAQCSVHAEESGATLLVGNASPKLVATLEECATLWREAIGPLAVRAAAAFELPSQAPSDGAETAPMLVLAPLPAHTQSMGAEPIAEAARRTLRRFFDKFLAREEAVLKGEDAEDIHQMRVATRRLRASLQVVEGVYEPELIQRYRRGLRQIARSLGAVRDGDVFLMHVVAYSETLAAAERAQLDRSIAAVRAERAHARTQLVKELESPRYHKHVRDFAEFLTTPQAGVLPAPEPGVELRVRDFAGSALWRRYELWRAYETVLLDAPPETLHQARIAGKRFRYALEFFAEALGPNVKQALDPLIALQENLGTLQDGVTARAHIAALELSDDPGALLYLAAREQERARLLAQLPPLWEKVASATYRRRLFELIVRL